MARERLVIVGAGMAAHRLVEEVLARAPDRYAITLLGAEAHPPYNRILLSQVLAGERHRDDARLADPESLAARGVRFRGSAEVVAVDRERRMAITAGGAAEAYDVLVFATGSSPIRLPLPGADLAGIVAFRGLDDVETMIAAAEAGAPAVVIGGGLLGLEAAAGLARRGMRVTVVHRAATLMERQIDAGASDLLSLALAARGIALRAPAATAAFVGDGRLAGVRLAGGDLLPARLAVLAVGVRPNIACGRAAGLRCGQGIIVDDLLATSDPAIFALGECVEHRGVTFGLVAPIWEQAAVLAARLAGGHGAYAGSALHTSLKVSGVDLFSAGIVEPGAGDEPLTLVDRASGIYRKLVLRDGRLAGALLFGDAGDSAWYLDLIRAATPVGQGRAALMFGPAYATELAA